MTGLAEPAEMLALIAGAGVLALDLETCSGPKAGMSLALNPRLGQVRILSLCDGKRSLVMDCFANPIQQLFPALESKILLVHNALFDLGWLYNLGLKNIPECCCTYLLSQLIDGTDQDKGHHSLAECCKRWLNRNVDKTLQASDFSGQLEPRQIEYARRDVEVLPPLFQRLSEEIEKSGQLTTSEIELKALPAWVWLVQSGVAFDQAAWLSLASKAESERDRLTRELDALAPAKEGQGLFGKCGDWNWASPQQVAEVFRQIGSPLKIEAKGHEFSTTNDAALALCDHPMAELLRQHREQATLVKLYGPSTWLAEAAIEDERLYPGWRQIGTMTGRTTCRKPNVQQISRKPEYRACFVAPPGKILVKADYATLQMRIACNQSRDQALFDVFEAEARGGPDVHMATAMRTLGKSKPSKADRQIAKSQNFGLLFGMSAEGLRIYARTTYGVTFTAEEAVAHRRAFFKAYPGLEKWHQAARHGNQQEARSRLGRRRRFWGNAPVTELLNTPVQQDESDGVKRAMGLLWQRRGCCPGAELVLMAHDELVVSVAEDQAETASEWLREAMLDGMQPVLDPVPTAVDVKVCRDWSGRSAAGE